MLADPRARVLLVALCVGLGALFGVLAFGSGSEAERGDRSDASALPPEETNLDAAVVETADTLVVDKDGVEDLADPVEEPEQPEETSSQVPLVIYDTDMGPDIDDALALAMLHTYQKRGAIELAAVTLSRPSEPGVAFIDVLNTFYQRPDIAIGMYRGDTVEPYDDNNSFVSEADQWPYDVDPSTVPEGYRVQRQVLERAITEGRRAIIVQTGFSGNTAVLTRSVPDDLSPRSGVELINESKVLLSIMAGSFDRNHAEFNIVKDLTSARELFSRWPGDMIVSPFELGYRVTYPYTSIQQDYGWIDRHPVREAYEFRDLYWHEDAPPFYNMRSWDLTSVMVAVEPDAGYFPISGWGTVYVDGSGLTTFREEGGRHRILHRSNEYTPEQKQRIVERMIELSSAQP